MEFFFGGGDTLYVILFDIICPVSISDQTKKIPCNFDKKLPLEKS